MIDDAAVNKYLAGLVYERALSKFRDNESIPVLASRAAEALKAAGQWHDDITIPVRMKNVNPSPVRMHRLLHGLPSPRYRKNASGTYCDMPAIDVLYFFLENINVRTSKYLEAMPEFQWVDDVELWIRTFTKRKFDEELVRAVMHEIASSIPATPNIPYADALRTAAIKRGACIAAEIDRYGWFRGYGSMNLAKAAPVFLPGIN